MAYASIAGRARTSSKKPQAHAICDRCGFRYNHVDLRWQYAWRGPIVQNIRLLVCSKCYDMPQEQLRAIVVPADPTPIINARTQDFEGAETNYRAVSLPPQTDPITGIPIPSTVLRITEDCNNRVTTPFGVPVGFIQQAVQPLKGTVHYGTEVPVMSVSSNGTATVTVTCSAVHNLHNDDQVSIQGLSNRAANGFYSVTILTATAFTYMTYGSIPAASLFLFQSRVITCIVGLPYGFKRIPKIDGPPLVSTEVPPTVCFLETEDGAGMFLLENGGGFIQLESCMQPPVSDQLLELEDGSGTFLLEGGFGSIELEVGP